VRETFLSVTVVSGGTPQLAGCQQGWQYWRPWS